MENEKAAIALKYKWRKTWPEHPNDFVGFDPDSLDRNGVPETIGRFYLSHMPDGLAWRWFSQWRPLDHSGALSSGVAATEREAAKAIENAYDRMKADLRGTRPGTRLTFWCAD